MELGDALLTSLGSKQLLTILLQKLHTEQNLQLDQLITLFQETKHEISVPLSIFSSRLQPAEALCKYLKENEKLSYAEISSLINRNRKSIWATYRRANEKMKPAFLNNKEFLIPISVFNNRHYSLLESVVLYLHQVYKLSNKQIAKLLKKSPNSMAVLTKRARDKYESKQ